MPTKTIKITCQGADALPLDMIEDFQGKLKKISKGNLEHLEGLILDQGFSFPIYVWIDKAGKHKTINGHQRTKALLSLRDKGYEIPLIPVDYIHADSEKEAREKVLSSTAQYGEFDIDELTEWVDQVDDDIKNLLRFTDSEIDIKTGGDIQEETEGGDQDGGITYTEQYGVIIICIDEAEQERVYNSLSESGYNCKVVVT